MTTHTAKLGDPSQSQSSAADFADLASAGSAAADSIDQAFSKVGASLGRSLAKGAADGKLSLADLAKTAISAVDALAGAGSSSPTSAAGGLGASLGSALATALGGLFGGARADGGPVSAGGAYLVGERGPEVFRPASGGEIGPASGSGLSINLTVQGAADPQAFVRSEAQIAQALARAARLGLR